MKKLGLLLLLASAACTKKPAPKPPEPPPTEPATGEKPGEAPKPDATNVPRTGDPCDGGQKPK